MLFELILSRILERWHLDPADDIVLPPVIKFVNSMHRGMKLLLSFATKPLFVSSTLMSRDNICLCELPLLYHCRGKTDDMGQNACCVHWSKGFMCTCLGTLCAKIHVEYANLCCCECMSC